MEGPMIALGLLSQIVLLAAAIALGHFLEKRGIRWLSEAAMAIVIGVIFGLVLRVSGVIGNFKDLISFKVDVFLFLLLPPIMFNSGYSLDVKAFKDNALGIILFAFVGTTVSMFAVGFTMWGAGAAGLCHKLGLLKSLLFGAIISATDPVTVIAVFTRLGAEPNIYSMVFGESVLNDAVGMVLYETMNKFVDHDDPVNVATIFKGIGIFFAIFIGSTLVGIAFGSAASFLARSHAFRITDSHSHAEPGVVIALGLASYYTAQAAHGSGIVAVFVAAIVMHMYTKPHLSKTAAHQVEFFWEVAAVLAETFVFIYIGTLLFIQHQEWDTWKFSAVTLFALGHSRIIHILPISAFVNKVSKTGRVNPKQQFMLWWSGLRGGMAAALALQAAEDHGKDGRVMMTATFFAAVVTVLVNGGSSSWLLEKLDLRSHKLPENSSHNGSAVGNGVKSLQLASASDIHKNTADIQNGADGTAGR